MYAPVDVVLLVPFQPSEAALLDPRTRRSVGAHYISSLFEALSDASDYTGQSLLGYTRPFADGKTPPWEVHRSLSAVALVTVLEKARLRWRALDPGVKQLAWWREELEKLAVTNPPLVAICSTYITTGEWLHMFVALVRRHLPRAKIAIGGYYYAGDTKDFLNLDAEILCVGEGEVRFPMIVEAVRDGRDMHDIPGLYLRRADGRLDYTGTVETLDMGKHCRPDWALAERIEPSVSLDHGHYDIGLETQRGCVFKCEFCTWRTLSLPNLMSPESAVERIMDTAVVRRGSIGINDATATFPHPRWADIMERLAARGGAPHPMRALARVSDIDDRTADLMKRARVCLLTIGQESGDQRVLDLMRKGTKVSHIAPAIRALARNKITVVLPLIVGFPGENAESAANTRNLLCTINDEFAHEPSVLVYRLSPFYFQDFATVGSAEKRTEHQDQDFQWASRGYTMEQSSREAFRTIIQVSKYMHAPAFAFAMSTNAITPLMLGGRYRFEVHRAAKVLDRLVAIFLDHRVFGTPIDRSELRRVRSELLEGHRPHGLLAKAKSRATARFSGRMAGTLRREWLRESGPTAGPITRVLITAKALSDTGSWRDTLASYQAGAYAAHDGASLAPSGEVVQEVAQQATALISAATLKAKHAKLPKTG